MLIATVGAAGFATAVRSITHVPIAHHPTSGRAPVGFILDDEGSQTLGILGCQRCIDGVQDLDDILTDERDDEGSSP
jgi:hypothetical protein